MSIFLYVTLGIILGVALAIYAAIKMPSLLNPEFPLLLEALVWLNAFLLLVAPVALSITGYFAAKRFPATDEQWQKYRCSVQARITELSRKLQRMNQPAG